MSTTTISLPRPFIFTNAWPASALMDHPSARGYMAKYWRSASHYALAATQTSRANRSRPCYESKAAGEAGAGGMQESPMRLFRLAPLLLLAGSLATASLSFAQTPPPPAPVAPQPKPGDSFGEEVTLAA